MLDWMITISSLFAFSFLNSCFNDSQVAPLQKLKLVQLPMIQHRTNQWTGLMRDNSQPCLRLQKIYIFDGKLDHLQPYLWRQKLVFLTRRQDVSNRIGGNKTGYYTRKNEVLTFCCAQMSFANIYSGIQVGKGDEKLPPQSIPGACTCRNVEPSCFTEKTISVGVLMHVRCHRSFVECRSCSREANLSEVGVGVTER